jgi:hypothetical protein
MANAIDETGMQYGRLIVLCREGSNYRHEATWRCRCECGKEVVVAGWLLRNGDTQSCGCLQRERAAEAKRKPQFQSEVIVADEIEGNPYFGTYW